MTDWTMTAETVGLVGYSTYAYLVPVTSGHLVELNKEVTNGLLPTHPLKQGIVLSHCDGSGHPLNLD